MSSRYSISAQVVCHLAILVPLACSCRLQGELGRLALRATGKSDLYA